MPEHRLTIGSRLAPFLVAGAALLLWQMLCTLHVLSHAMFPTPHDVWLGVGEELRAGRLFNDLIASLWRVAIGFGLAVLLSVPFGLWIGSSARARQALMPAINFMRSLSPIAWVGFAVVWFGIGDKPAIFLIFLSVFFPLAVTVGSAVATIPAVYYRVARDYGIEGRELLARVVLPAIMPQLITALRVTIGVSWVVLVAAEMVAGHDGLGYAIQDDRNALRQDLLVVHMIVIGLVGIVLDRLLLRLTRVPSVRWGYER
jgi:NitT/TauT family transport system permease protein